MSGAFSEAQIAQLEASEDGSFWFRSRNRLIVSTIRRRFGEPRSILEVGCGTGYVLSALAQAFPGSKITGADPSSPGISVARRRVPEATFLVADAQELRFDEPFDMVGSFDVLEHIADDGTAIQAIARTVRRGGGLIVTVPQHPWLWSSFDELSGHERRYTRSDLVAKLRRAGFRNIRATSFVTLLLPALVVARRRPSVDLADSLQLPTVVDRSFEGVMTFERFLHRAGIPFPAGGSLLVTATR
jgi:SAM-dependent methyltransferase